MFVFRWGATALWDIFMSGRDRPAGIVFCEDISLVFLCERKAQRSPGKFHDRFWCLFNFALGKRVGCRR